MASRNLVFLFYFQLFLFGILPFAYHASAQLSSAINIFKCSPHIKTCNSLLYQHNQLPEAQIAKLYSVNKTAINPIAYSGRQDYLINVPCSCGNANGATGYFYDTVYHVRKNDTFYDVSDKLYSGTAWVGGNEKGYFLGEVKMNLLCGCVETETQTVVTYTVQEGDNIRSIANLLSADVDEIMKLNPYLIPGPEFLIDGIVLFVPMNDPILVS